MEGADEHSADENSEHNSEHNAEVNPEKPLRTAEGRFQKGRSGNPKGRPPGARNRATHLEEAVRAAEQQLASALPAIIENLIFYATHGGVPAQRLLLQRIYPAPRQRPIRIALPEIRSAADIPAAVRDVVAGVAAGELTPDEGRQMLDLLAKAQNMLTVSELADRVAKLEVAAGAADGLKEKLLQTEWGTFAPPV